MPGKEYTGQATGGEDAGGGKKSSGLVLVSEVGFDKKIYLNIKKVKVGIKGVLLLFLYFIPTSKLSLHCIREEALQGKHFILSGMLYADNIIKEQIVWITE